MKTLIWLAATTPPVSPGAVTTPKADQVSPGFAGFLTIFLLSIATIILLRSMVKHLRKVRYSPDPADPANTAITAVPDGETTGQSLIVSPGHRADEAPVHEGKDQPSAT